MRQIEQEKSRKTKKIRNVEDELTKLIPFNKKRDAYA